MTHLTLASQSPRRAELLRLSGYHFDILPTQISEFFDKNLTLNEAISALSLEKAQACLKMKRLHPESPILAADTTVAIGDRVLEKPADAEEALEFLGLLSGNWHKVLTGHAMINPKNQKIETLTVETLVKFRKLSAANKDAYIKTMDWKDKAGGYGIQTAGVQLVEQVRGEFDNVMGLSVAAVGKILKKVL